MTGKNLHSTSKLTEFAPLSPDDRQSGVGNFISKLFRGNKGEVKDRNPRDSSGKDSPSSSSLDTNNEPLSSNIKTPPVESSNLPESPFQVSVSEGRSLPNVLKRLSSLVALKNVNLQAYGDTDLKQYWMPDAVSRECYDCGERFTTFRRRHHCRICGQIFCSRCCCQEVPGKIVGCTGDLRVCTYCCKVVLSYLQSADMSADLSADLRAVQEDLQNKFGAAMSAQSSNSVSSSGRVPSSNVSPQNITEREDVRLGISCSSTSSFISTIRRKHSVGYQEERFALGRDQPVREMLPEEDRSWALHALCQQLLQPGKCLQVHTVRVRLRVHHNVFTGSQLVDWFLDNGKAVDRGEATVLGEALVEAGFLECVTEDGFSDSCALYRLVWAQGGNLTLNPSGSEACISPTSVGQEGQEPSWVKDVPHRLSDSNTTTDSEPECLISEVEQESAFSSSLSTYQLDLDTKQSTAHLVRPKSTTPSMGEWVKQSEQEISPSSELLSYALLHSSQRNNDKNPVPWHQISQLRSDNGDLQAYTALNEKYVQHEKILLNQLLYAEGLSQSWADIVMPLIHQIASIVHPDSSNDAEEMDIRHYIQFKKVTGGTRSECKIMNGIAFTKNVAHRSMVSRLENPRILLLNCAIVYQRVEGRFLSLEPVMMQEQDYLRNVVARIEALQPDLILVSRNVSRLAQESLRLLGVTLALNVKLSVLERIARCTQAQIITSVDAHIGRPQLGTCKRFYVRTFSTEQGSCKTLMLLESCPLPQFGCSVLLRGGNQSELSRIKRVMRHMVFCRYHWNLELSYLMDEFACPPNVMCDTFFEEANFSQNESVNSKQSTSTKNWSSTDLDLNQAATKLPSSEAIPGTYDQEGKQDILTTEPSTSDNSYQKEIHKSKADLNYSTRYVGMKIRRRNSSSDQPDAMKRVTGESISDFSDPLHQYLTLGDEGKDVETSNSQHLAVAKIPNLNQFRKALDDTILSISPYLKFTVPFLETDQGRSCSLRHYFPEEIYWSQQFLECETARSRQGTGGGSDGLTFPYDVNNTLKIAPKHSFMDMKITLPVSSAELQEVLADFRACGGRISPGHTLQSNHCVSHQPHPLAMSDGSIDVLDPWNHQHLSVLFCSYSTFSQNAPAFCVNPWVVKMDFYGRNDITLGSFLERYCFRTSYQCPSQTCSASMLQHVRRFVHYPGCVQVTLQLVEGVGSLPTNDHILMWSCCSLCSVVSPVTPMSPDTWALSFGKYLELRFHGDMYSLREEHVDKVDQASLPCSHSLHHHFYQYFGYRNVVASFKYSPILVWEVSLPPKSVRLYWETHHLASVSDEINEIAVAGQQIFSKVLEYIFDTNSEDQGIKSQLQKDQAQFKAKVDDALVVKPPLTEAEHWNVLWHLEDTVVDLLRLIIEAVAVWNTRLNALDQRSRIAKGSVNILPDAADEATVHIQEEVIKDMETTQCTEKSTITTALTESLTQECGVSGSHDNGSAAHEQSPVEQPQDLISGQKSLTVDPDLDLIPDQSEPPSQQSVQTKSVKTILSQLLPSGSMTSAIVVPPKLQEIHVMQRSSASVPIAVRESQPSTIIAHALASFEYQRSLEEMMQNPPSDSSGGAGPQMAPKKVYASNDRERDKEKDRDSLNGELLQSSELRRAGVLSFLRGSPNAVTKDSGNIEGVAYTTGLTSNSSSSVSPEGPAATNISSPTSTPAQQNATYIEVQFSDASTIFFCRIYYAEEFQKLRQLIWPRGEEGFIRSLAHCVPWAARGGKSGSTFCKTRDDRLVLKEMSRAELSHFLDRAPHFFHYMIENHKNDSPTLLGKILGVYRIAFKNDATGVASRSNLLVMENLFYGREVSHRFDLKGSVRNRLVNPGSEPRGEVVLLDENLLKLTRDSPLYLLPHAKSVLIQAIKRDTEFLSSQSIMDYSLLVGLDQTRKELVVGIIDYIRSFTWDKRLENVFKKMAGQGRAPTIVQPEEYQNRFIAAMHSYFLTAPDRWYGFGQGFQ